MTSHPVVDVDAWRAARLAHLEKEKEFTRARDALSAARRGLPWLEVTVDYRFTGAEGEASLLDLFGDSPQLLIYHFMMGPGWEEGCPSCSFWADNHERTARHLAARNTRLVVVARGPFETIHAYRERMGWTTPWYSSFGSDFNFDMGVSFTQEQVDSGELLYNYGTIPAEGQEEPGVSAFRRVDDRIYLTYQTFSRGLDMLNGAYHHLDVTSMGRDEDQLPWVMAWLHRHDQYPD
jgi:predicted dithiol-disulfide oxidoreductase (DUF899 family)